VAVNKFDGELAYELDEVREALTLSPDVLLTTCDARDPGSTSKALQELVSYTMECAVSYGPSPIWGQ
jgi:signal recognition particle receptor subunit beta